MFNNYFELINFMDFMNIWLYFWNHIILIIFFTIHFFCIKFLKYKIDWKNIILKNFKNFELNRTIINSIKTLFFIETQNLKRTNFYFKVV